MFALSRVQPAPETVGKRGVDSGSADSGPISRVLRLFSGSAMEDGPSTQISEELRESDRIRFALRHARRMRKVRDLELRYLRTHVKSRLSAGGQADLGAPTVPTTTPAPMDSKRLTEKINKIESSISSEWFATTPGVGAIEMQGVAEGGEPEELLSISWGDDLARVADSASAAVFASASTQRPLDEAAALLASSGLEAAVEVLRSAIEPGSEYHHDQSAWQALMQVVRLSGRLQEQPVLEANYRALFGQVNPPTQELLPRGVVWTAAAQLSQESLGELMEHMACDPQVCHLDWSQLRAIDPDILNDLTVLARCAALLPTHFNHFEAKLAIAMIRSQCVNQESRQQEHLWWITWHALLNWMGRQQMFSAAATAFQTRFNIAAAPWEKPLCKTSFNAPFRTQEFMARLSGDICTDSDAALDALEALVDQHTTSIATIDCSGLLRLDFVCAARILNLKDDARRKGRDIELAGANPLIVRLFELMGSR
jgi:ABC-type transporter Mla MlaB component